MELAILSIIPVYKNHGMTIWVSSSVNNKIPSPSQN